jgi:hypothetical protein
MTRIAMQTAMRDAAMSLLLDFKAQQDIKLQIYRARPASIAPPTAFVDRMRERITFIGPVQMQRQPSVDVVVLHGLFDHGDTVDQRDKFVDAFLEFVADRPHEAGPNTMIGGVSVEDDPTYIPDWLSPEKQRTYFASVITLEGLALD